MKVITFVCFGTNNNKISLRLGSCTHNNKSFALTVLRNKYLYSFKRMEKTMNKIVLTALASVVLGLGSASVYAGGPDRGPGPSKPTKPHKPGKHACGDKCDGKINVVLDVARHCDLDIVDETLTLAQAQNGTWTDTGTFNVRTNAPYRLQISAPNTLTGAGGAVPVQVSTRQNGAADAYNGGTLASTGNADQAFNVTATVAQNDYNNADAGTYRGTYTVAVRF